MGLRAVQGDDRHRRSARPGRPWHRRWGSIPMAPRSTWSRSSKRITGIEDRLESQGRGAAGESGRQHRRRHRLAGGPPHDRGAAPTDRAETIHADAVMVSTGQPTPDSRVVHSRRDRVLTTRDAYPPERDARTPRRGGIGCHRRGVRPHVLVASAREVTLIVSRQQVLPGKDPEVAAVLEDDFLGRGVKSAQGRTGSGNRCRPMGRWSSVAMTVGSVEGSHVLLAIGSIPNLEGIGLDAAGVEIDGDWVRTVDHHMRTNVDHIYVAGDVSGKLPLSVGGSDAGTQDRRARDGAAQGRPPPPRLRQGGIGDLHRSRRSRMWASPRPMRSPKAAR